MMSQQEARAFKEGVEFVEQRLRAQKAERAKMWSDFRHGGVFVALIFSIVPVCSMIANGGGLVLLLFIALGAGVFFGVRWLLNRY